MTTDWRPDFIIIGATKSATTWLQQCLQLHPKVFMPGPELHYFSRCYDKGHGWYRAQFDGAGPDRLIGEKSNSYLDEPPAEIRLQAFAPDARLIVQLRNPIERAYSDYCMLLRRGEVDRDIDRYLGAGSPLKTRLLDSGLYHRHLTRYLDLFPREQLLVTLYDDMRARPAALLGEVGRHIGLDTPVPNASETGRKVKDKTTPILHHRLRRLLGPIKPLAKPFRDNALFIAVRGLLARPIDYPPLTPSIRATLSDYLRADIEALSTLLGRDLGHWLSEPAKRAA